jgi:D-inositol-3-phosphate glycosyltransferase
MNVYIRELSRELVGRGHEVDIFTRQHDTTSPQVYVDEDGVRVIHLQAGPSGTLPKEDLYPHLPQFLHNMRHFQEESGCGYDVIHTHYWLSGWVGSKLAPRWGVPHITMFHTLGKVKNQSRLGERESSLRIETEARVMADADAVVVASLQEKANMSRLYKRVPRRVEVIPCGVDLDHFKPMNQAQARQELGLAESPLLLFVGRIEPLKGIPILLNAVAGLEEKDGLRVLVVGGDSQSGNELERLSSMAAQLGIGERVSFVGSVDHMRLPLFYNAADVCVVPSYHESFGMVAVEALACGTPVVASRVGGLMTTVRDGETGFLIPWRCPEPFAERLELLLGNEALREGFGRAGRASVEMLSWSAVAERVGNMYTELVREEKKPALCSG